MNDLAITTLFDLEAFPFKNIFSNCIYPWEALSFLKIYLEKVKLGQIEVAIQEGVHLENKELISIGAGTVIEAGAFIRGPCLIGTNCVIRQGAYLRGGVVAGNYAVIGHATEAKNSIFLNHAQAAHFAYVGDSILGNKVNLGAGTILANLRLDRKEIKIYHKEQEIITGRKKMGAILGDFAQTGCNSVLNPGTIFLKNSICLPCENISGVVRAK
jgi:UDP-N-acetylglucosamine diphosphorylase / glucose-1-phosphate thymidylyltransferase / UDP-N-acetylgalactosamine diphosphorylase / glucosamine-1-phosphate N-acetyltransferase / galactosamine-1-phosphate N-acetyltransferase